MNKKLYLRLLEEKVFRLEDEISLLKFENNKLKDRLDPMRKACSDTIIKFSENLSQTMYGSDGEQK